MREQTLHGVVLETTTEWYVHNSYSNRQMSTVKNLVPKILAPPTLLQAVDIYNCRRYDLSTIPW